MLGSRRYIGTGGYHTGEKHVVFTAPGGHVPGQHAVIVCHGSTLAGASYYLTPSIHRDLDVLANAGCVVICIDHGDPNKPDNWGNDTAIARVDEAITWAQSEWSCDTGTVSVIADSAGGPTALGWAWRNPDQLAACVLRLGVVDISATHARNPLLQVLINNAYNNGWAAAAATHDPMLNTASIVPIADRIRIYFSTDDGLILPTDVAAFSAATGVRAIPLGAVGHDDTRSYPALPVEAQAGFIRSHI